MMYITVIFCYRYEYHWADGSTVKRPLKCSAPKYIDYLMAWVQEQLEDENVFPSKIGTVLYVHLSLYLICSRIQCICIKIQLVIGRSYIIMLEFEFSRIVVDDL